ncbi:MAG: LPS assembly protein LptD, partial [Burkholderiaceae bacterium]|nr:LPS assembly protein LptD [Burkholderiaceae bacterium]
MGTTAPSTRIVGLSLAACCAFPGVVGAEAFSLGLARTLSEEGARVTIGRPVYGRAERISGNPDREITFSGDAEMRHAGTVVRGARITYYPQDDEVVAGGGVRVVRESNVFTGPELRLKLDASEGFFASPSYYIALHGGRGDAEELEFLGPKRFSLRNASYTTCRPGDSGWQLEMESLLIDEERQEASGRSANLKFNGSTILYAPWFAFPLGEDRRSGVLTPSFALTSRSGPEVTLPYYWNIAPNRDFTLYPRVMQRRGLQLGGQFRFLEPKAFGDLRFEYAPHDSVTGTSRSFASVQSTFADFAGWNGAVTARAVSDDDYFVDYSRSILASSERSLPRDFVATRAFGDWNLTMRATRYQSILDARLAPPYERVPQLNLSWARRDLLGLDAELMLDATQFRRPLAGSPEGTRLIAHPRVSYPIVRPGWFVVPKLGLHLSSYQLDA